MAVPFLLRKVNTDNANWYNSFETEDNYVKLPTEQIKEKIEETKVTNLSGFIPTYGFPVSIIRITSPYGWRNFNGKKVLHNGVDYTGQNKNAIAPSDLIIKKYVKPDYEYPCKFKYNNETGLWGPAKIPEGRAWTPYILAQCVWDETIKFVFRHVDILSNLNVGSTVKIGEPLAILGNWGYSQGSHLHFEVLKNDQNINPHQFILDKLKKA
jgi:murein DD-endopeptidase MepM/ murein hydrolase activator NlpD